MKSMTLQRHGCGKKGYKLDAWSVVTLDDKYNTFFEVKGPQLMSLDEVRSLENELSAKVEIPLEIFVRSVPEAVMTKDSYTTLEQLLDTFGQRTRAAYDKETRELLESWR